MWKATQSISILLVTFIIQIRCECNDDLLYLNVYGQADCVKLVQQVVGANISGNFDLSTHLAVAKFQTDNDLYVDGIVGPKTWPVIKSKLQKLPAKQFKTAIVQNVQTGGICGKADKFEETLDFLIKPLGRCQNLSTDPANTYEGQIGFTCWGITPKVGYTNRDSFTECSGFTGHPSGFVKWCYDQNVTNFKNGIKRYYRQNFMVNVCDHLDQPAFYVCSDIAIYSPFLNGVARVKEFLKELGPQGSDAKAYAQLLNSRDRKYYDDVSKSEMVLWWLEYVDDRAKNIDKC